MKLTDFQREEKPLPGDLKKTGAGIKQIVEAASEMGSLSACLLKVIDGKERIEEASISQDMLKRFDLKAFDFFILWIKVVYETSNAPAFLPMMLRHLCYRQKRYHCVAIF